MSLTGNNVLGGASGDATNQPVFTIDQSLRINDDDNGWLTRTPSSASNRKTWTWSCWVKLGNIPAQYRDLFTAMDTSPTASRIQLTSREGLRFYTHDGSSAQYKETSAVFRDPSSWYHFIIALDTTQSSNNDRLKIYINGELQTSFENSDTFVQDADLQINSTLAHWISNDGTPQFPHDGYLAEMHFVDGQQLDASSFGKEDSDTGQWKPIEVIGMT